MKRTTMPRKESPRGAKRRKLRHDDGSDGPTTDDNFYATQQRQLGDASKPDQPLIDPSMVMSAKSNGSLFDGKTKRLGRDQGPVETPVDPMSSRLSISGKERPHGTKEEGFSHCDSPDARPVDGSLSTSAPPCKESPNIHEKRRLSQENAPDDGPDESSVDTESPKSAASGTGGRHRMKKRKSSRHDDPEPKKIRSEHPVDDGAQAFQRWLKRRLQRPPPAVFADTTIRREAQKLKRLPAEIRRMIYGELFDARGGRIRVDQADNEADLPLKFSIAGKPMEGAHYLNPRCVGDQIAAEAMQSLYEQSLFEVDFLALLTLLQECCLFLPRKQFTNEIRDLSIDITWERHYRSYGRSYTGYARNDGRIWKVYKRNGINPADWISPTEIGLVRRLDDYYDMSDACGGPRQRVYNRGEYKIDEHGGRAGLRALCQMSRLRSVEFRLHAEENGDLELRRIIPTVRFLQNRGVMITVWSGRKDREAADDIHSRGRPKSPKWSNLSDLFDIPSSADEDLAANHAHGKDWYFELTQTSRGFQQRQRHELYPRIREYRSGASCDDRGCVRVEVNELWKQLKDLMGSKNKELPNHFGYAFGPKSESAFDLRKYGSVPAARAALKAEEELQMPNREDTESRYDGLMRRTQRGSARKSNILQWPLDSRFNLATQTDSQSDNPAGADDSSDCSGETIPWQDYTIQHV